MDNLAMWNLLAGFLSATFVLPVIQQPRWSPAVRAAVTFGYSIVVGLVAAWLTGGFRNMGDAQSAVTSVLMTLVAAVASYKGFAQPTGLAGSIERATSPTPSPPVGGGR